MNRNLAQDYLADAPSLQPFYQYSPQAPDFEAIIRDKKFSAANRKVLTAVLNEQYQGYHLPDALAQNLHLLESEDTYTLTTGHQLGLMGGPLFTVYKVANIIRLARELKEKIPHKNFVPVFWIHTEDHDFEEINHYFEDFKTKHTYTGTFQGPVGKHILNETIDDLIPAHFSDALKNAYQPGKTMAEAFKAFFHALFAEAGLVILDPDHPKLKSLFSGVLTAEVEQGVAATEVGKTTTLLGEAGYHTQIHPREINLFYMDWKGRNRLVAENGHFRVLDRNLRFDQKEMADLIKNQPEKFSPNVSLRPLYQEMILPNLAYIGGWGELAYWMQLGGLFAHFKVNFPLLLPRFSATLMRAEDWDAWQKMGFAPADIRKPLHELQRLYMPTLWSDEAFKAKVADIETALEALHGYIETDIAATLARSLEALQVKNRKYLANVEKKIYRVLRSQHPKPFRALEDLKNKVQPDGFVQERVLSLASFPDVSPEKLVEILLKVNNPLDLSHQFIRLD